MENSIPDEKKEKYCAKCSKWKDVSEFYKRGKDSRYYTGYCKACHKDQSQYDRIVCPHCQNKIHFFGVNIDGKVAKQKSELLKRLTKTVTDTLNKVKKGEKITKKDLRDLFEE